MTSIEWLAEMASKMGYVSVDIIEQAKEMHKAEILDAFEEGSSDGFYGWGSSNKEKYYQETFKKD